MSIVNMIIAHFGRGTGLPVLIDLFTTAQCSMKIQPISGQSQSSDCPKRTKMPMAR